MAMPSCGRIEGEQDGSRGLRCFVQAVLWDRDRSSRASRARSEACDPDTPCPRQRATPSCFHSPLPPLFLTPVDAYLIGTPSRVTSTAVASTNSARTLSPALMSFSDTSGPTCSVSVL